MISFLQFQNAVVNGDVSPAKKPRKTPPTPISKPANIAPHSTPTQKSIAPAPADDTPKLKIYKCGFCSFQSKDLNSVR